MRRFTLIAFSLVMLAGSSQAQEFSLKRTTGYLFIAPGGLTNGREAKTIVHAGGGADVRIWKGLTAGAELGGIGGGDRLAIFSTNASYRFLNATPNRKLVPYVTAGYTAAGNMEFAERWFNFGAGADYWIGQRTGVRLEFRDHVDANHYEPRHYLEARVGFIWR